MENPQDSLTSGMYNKQEPRKFVAEFTVMKRKGWLPRSCYKGWHYDANDREYKKILDTQQCISEKEFEKMFVEDNAALFPHNIITPENFNQKAYEEAVKKQNNLQDTGERTTFQTGAKREVLTEKGRYDLIPPIAIHRLAVHFANGARKYGARNWEKGLPLCSFLNSVESHLNKLKYYFNKYACGEDLVMEEDHAAAILWNICAYIWTKDQIEKGLLDKSLIHKDLYDE